MGNITRLVALLIAFVLMPGAAEMVENAAHVVSDGHTAHAIDDADHAPRGDEHGCSGTYHVCSCHASPSFLLGNVAFAFGPDLVLSSPLNSDAEGRPSVGHSLGVYRPPSA